MAKSTLKIKFKNKNDFTKKPILCDAIFNNPRKIVSQSTQLNT